MTGTPLHALGFHANSLARNTKSEQMQAVLQWVGVGSVILMGAAAAVHLVKDLIGTPERGERFSRASHQQMLDNLEQHYRNREGHGHSR